MLLSAVVDDDPPDGKLHRRFLKFINTCSQSNTPAKMCAYMAIHGNIHSAGSDSYNIIRFLYFDHVNSNCMDMS